MALRCMTDPGDEVLIPQPSYVSYLPCAVMADAVPVADAVHNLSYLLDTPIAIRVREKRGKGLED